MEGYKKTELGLIPEDWEVVKLGEVSNVTTGGTPDTKMPEYWGGQIPWMSSGEVNLRRVSFVEGRITSLGLENSSTKMIPENSVLMALAGQGKTRGKVAINEVPLCINQSLAAIAAHESILSTEFLFHDLDFRYLELRAISSGDGGRGGLNLRIIKSISIPLPPLPEQKAIAAILGTVDEKLDALSSRMTETEELKKGLMQRLLREGIGHTRFQDSPLGRIPADWEVVRLGEVVSDLTAGVSVNSEDREIEKGELGILKTSALSNGKFLPEFHKTILRKEIDRAKISPQKGCIIISRMNTPLLVGESAYVHEDFPNLFLPDRLWQTKFATDFKLNSKWLSYVFIGNSFRAELRIIATGTSGSMKNISKPSLLNLEIPLPPLPEQKKIAAILSTVDKRLENLQSQKSAFQDLKKGLMQQLLTGKMRVKYLSALSTTTK
jgi:type I restriction enzyme S subunit